MPILIAHRGNVDGRAKEHENNPKYLAAALASYDHKLHCEIDVWYVAGSFYLGHDMPTYMINEEYLMNERFWCHAKNHFALQRMLANPQIHCFWHQEDDYTITSKGFIWVYPGKELIPGSVCVMPELAGKDQDLSKVYGICSDRLSPYMV